MVALSDLPDAAIMQTNLEYPVRKFIAMILFGEIECR